MKKQYKLYYHTTFTSKTVVNQEVAKYPEMMHFFMKCTGVLGFSRVDVCTCDNIYTARVLRDIIHDSLGQEVQIEEVEVDNYDE